MNSNNPPVPDSTRKKFPDLVELILASPSMNQTEQNYWIRLLPTLSSKQITDLRTILEDEKRALDEIDAKHATNLENISLVEANLQKQQNRSKKLQAIQHAEELSESEEDNLEDKILRELNEQ